MKEQINLPINRSNLTTKTSNSWHFMHLSLKVSDISFATLIPIFSWLVIVLLAFMLGVIARVDFKSEIYTVLEFTSTKELVLYHLIR